MQHIKTAMQLKCEH